MIGNLIGLIEIDNDVEGLVALSMNLFIIEFSVLLNGLFLRRDIYTELCIGGRARHCPLRVYHCASDYR